MNRIVAGLFVVAGLLIGAAGAAVFSPTAAAVCLLAAGCVAVAVGLFLIDL